MRARMTATICGIAAGSALLMAAAAPAASNLSLNIADSPDPVVADAELTYVIQVANTGADPATGVTLTDELDPQLDFTSVTSTQGPACKRTGKTITCELGTIAPG